VLITYSTCIKEKFPGELVSKDCSQIYIGSGWLYKLGEKLRSIGITIESSQTTIQKIQSNKIRASEVFLIQDGKNKSGLELCDMGAQKFLILNLESPLYDPYFYKSLHQYINGFEWVYCYDGFTKKIPNNQSKLTPFFPAYSLDQISSATKTPKENKVCLIASNKYMSSEFISSPQVRKNLSQVKQYAKLIHNIEFRYSIAACLHKKRLKLITELAENNLIDLYGHGWNNLSNLPTSLRLNSQKLIEKIYKGPATNKHATMSNYKFCLSIENIALNGYITEKIIDPLVTNTIPIYFGAPDIKATVPKNVFIDGQSYKSTSELVNKIFSMASTDIDQMNLNGSLFLRKQGNLYSSDSVAQIFFEKIMSRISHD
jgi:hypothetical protein